MVHKYLKAIISGVFGIILMIVLFIFIAYSFTSTSESNDSGPAAIGAAFIFGIVVLVSMIFIGMFSTWWAIGRNSSIKKAVEVSAIAGAIPTIGLCLMILTFEFLVSSYGPSGNFSFISFLNTLTSGLTLCCVGSFIIGILLSVIGGIIYTIAASLFRKPKYNALTSIRISAVYVRHGFITNQCKTIHVSFRVSE